MNPTQRPSSTPALLPSAELAQAKWGWACRMLPRSERFGVGEDIPAQVGDVVVARVLQIRNHTRIMTRDELRVRIYSGDVVVGVLGNRYATDAFEGVARVESGRVDLMTNAGMMGQVRRRHSGVKAPTKLEVLGPLIDTSGRPVNLIERCFCPRPVSDLPRNVLFVLGTGMNAGKTTSATKLVRGLLGEGLKVAALKVTGSVSPNDRSELAATGASWVRDFSDYGFPSTYLESLERLRALTGRMLADASAVDPDVVVVELADGVLQRETAALIGDSDLQRLTLGAVLAAPCALSALQGVEEIRSAGLRVLGVTGIISNAPLFVREFEATSTVPVLSSGDEGQTLGRGLASSVTAAKTRDDSVFAA